MKNAHDIYHSEDAISITHVVEEADGQRILLADLQRMDAASDPTSVAVQKNQARLPLFLHPHADQVLFLGLGTGVTAAGALAWPEAQLTAVELSRGAIEASASYFKRVNDDIHGKIDLVHDDARRFLMRTSHRYDVIVGDLFHPDMVGRGALLSVEQFHRAKAHLRDGGLFVQWLACNQFDRHSLQVVLATFAEAFPHDAIFIDGYRMALVGFHDSSFIDVPMLLAAAPEREHWGGEGGFTWLGRYWGHVSDLLQGSREHLPLQGEWTPVIEYALPRLHTQQSPLVDILGWLLAKRVHISKGIERWQLKGESLVSLKRAWAATSLNMKAQWLMLSGLSGAERLQKLAYRANKRDRWSAFARADAMFAAIPYMRSQGRSDASLLLAVLAVRPDHEGALKAIYQWYKKAGQVKLAEQYRQKFLHLSPYGRIE